MKTSILKRTGFTRSQRQGILLLSILIAIVQIFCLLPENKIFKSRDPESRKWLALSKELDSLKLLASRKKVVVYPFNPNFISDYKGYRLGMSVPEIDRLHAFRDKGKFVNSALEFQNVTKVSDSLLGAISPYFKFPDWVNRKQQPSKYLTVGNRATSKSKLDINLCDKQELMAVYGIGDALSDRIIKQREVLGGFVDMKQMHDIWGLSRDVIEKLQQRFEVRQLPELKKIRVNEASVKELAAFPYFRYAVAKSIVTFRSMNGKINKPDDLLGIENFPVDNVKIISLYLEF
ncbi:helix-hairpin-helix domain-containing protein [Flavobacterium selenitireducens]|uniref:helix-hairpin-helix domain-containing protein n=1 Tax=Flavobacterium selenitireducens TaxID=2722704 RepID=UPI00168AF47E|nr:helix-hairpin-helix domain-containing protein [Flavobacterium selenitireducens]MBD3583401.1 helix-hairpin-helix domain-containing protein [Flavobacterium selenitireducens]